jgi:uncharacterized protein (DUF433 family)
MDRAFSMPTSSMSYGRFKHSKARRDPTSTGRAPRLRIVPGKLAGVPHIEATRLETQAIAALARRGMPRAKIYRLYPIADEPAIDQALELEQQLDANLGLKLVAA